MPVPTCKHVVHCVRPVGSRSFKMAIEAKKADTNQRRSPQPKGRKNATPKPVIIADAAAKITEVVNAIRRGRKKWAVHSKAIRKKMADSPRHYGSNLLIPVSPEGITAATQPMITSATTATAIRPEATREMSLSFFFISVIKVLPSPRAGILSYCLHLSWLESIGWQPNVALTDIGLNIQRRSR